MLAVKSMLEANNKKSKIRLARQQIMMKPHMTMMQTNIPIMSLKLLATICIYLHIRCVSRESPVEVPFDIFMFSYRTTNGKKVFSGIDLYTYINSYTRKEHIHTHTYT
jgi:uncharacterized membrane protein (DUF106 family)